MTTQPQPLADRIAEALRAAAYDCDGTCGLNERECDAQHPIQVAVIHHDVIAAVYGDITDLASVAAAVVQAELDARDNENVRLHAELRIVEQQTWQQAAERVATELGSIDPAEWALAGQHAGNDAIRIARAVGARCNCPATGKPGHYIDHLTDPATADDVPAMAAEIRRLRSAAQSAAVLLRSIDANANTGRPQDITAIRAAARALDDTTTQRDA
jgi:hypothetical protein